MKLKRPAREIILMTLPVVLLIGVACWLSQGGSLLALRGIPSDLYTGKPRLDIGQSAPLLMSSWDVAQGPVWGKKVFIWQKGQAPLDMNARRCAHDIGSLRADVFYRRNTVWNSCYAVGSLYNLKI